MSIALSLGFGFLTLPLRAQTVVDTVCAGARGEVYQVLATTGSSYRWDLKGGVVRGGNGSSQVSIDWGTDTGIFQVQVVEFNNNGCPGDTVRAFVWIRNGISVNIEGPSAICIGDQVTLLAEGSANLTWNTGAKGNKLKVKPTVSTDYFVIGYSPYCGIDTAHFHLQVNERPEAAFVVNPDEPKIKEDVNFFFTGLQSNGNIIWNIDQGTVIKEGEQMVQRFSAPGNYSVQLIVIDDNGCADTANNMVKIKADVNVFVPNSFTPNGDGLNDTFAPECSDIKGVKIQVYSRWGELIYRGEGMEAAWDGSYRGTNVPDGVYSYVIQVIGVDNKTYNYEGTLTLLR